MNPQVRLRNLSKRREFSSDRLPHAFTCTAKTIKYRIDWVVLVLFFLIGLGNLGWAGKKGVVASVHPLATEAGLNALRQGGNAVDAAVAVGLTLGVVDGFNSGIGGGCFILIHTPRGERIATTTQTPKVS